MPAYKDKTGSKRIKINLYRVRDMDLLSLYLHNPKEFISHIEKAVEAVATGQKYVIPTPPVGFKNNFEGYVKPITTLQFNVKGITLRTLGKLKPRMMQSFINTCIRNCMDHLPIENFFKGDGIEFNKNDYELNRMLTEGETEETQEEKPVKENKEKKKPPRKRAPATSMQTIAEQKIEELGKAARKEMERKEAERLAAEKKAQEEAEKQKAEQKTVTAPETEVRPVSEIVFPAMPIAPIIETEDVEEETPATSTIQAAGQEDFPPMPIAPIIDDTPAEDDSDDSDMFAQLAELVHPH